MDICPGSFIAGLVFACIVAIAVNLGNEPTIARRELYRFCMVHSVPLEQCKTVPPLYKGDSNDSH